MSGASDLERRYSSSVQVEAGNRLRGTAIVFNSLSRDLGGFREIIDPDAVIRSLRQAEEIHAFYNHDSGKVLGNTKAGTLILRADRRGLNVEITPPSWATDILESVDRGDVRGMSFGFRTKADWVEWDERNEDLPVRIVHDMEFSEVSIVAKPAYTDTDISVAVRSLRAYIRERSGISLDLARKLHQTRLV
jgi:HK97 family phage prohead protease